MVLRYRGYCFRILGLGFMDLGFSSARSNILGVGVYGI